MLGSPCGDSPEYVNVYKCSSSQSGACISISCGLWNLSSCEWRLSKDFSRLDGVDIGLEIDLLVRVFLNVISERVS